MFAGSIFIKGFSSRFGFINMPFMHVSHNSLRFTDVKATAFGTVDTIYNKRLLELNCHFIFKSKEISHLHWSYENNFQLKIREVFFYEASQFFTIFDHLVVDLR